MLDLYYFPNNASLAPHLLLAETHAEYSLKLVDRGSNAQKSKEYLKLNPAGRIPTLVHGDLVLFESPAICIYICELDAGSRFIRRRTPRSSTVLPMADVPERHLRRSSAWRIENHTTDAAGLDNQGGQDHR